MDERIMQFRVGVVVVAVTLIAGFLTLLFGHLPASVLHKTNTLYVEFPEATGVSTDTPLRKSGILIGRVTKVELIGEQQDRVLVTIAVDQDYKILQSDSIRIAVSLLGDAELQVVPGANQEAKIPLEPGARITGKVYASPLQTIDKLAPEMQRAAESFTNTSEQIRTLAEDFHKLLPKDTEQFNRLMSKTERSLDTLQKTMNNFDSIIGDPETNARLRQSISELPNTLKQAEDALTLIQKTSTRAEKNLANLENFTKPLGDRGESLVNNADSSIRRLDELLGQMQQFSKQLNSRDGSLGQLLYNPQLYQNLNEAATNINELTRQVKPIINDIRAFSDKIARHPEVIGLGGIKTPSTGIK